MTSKVEMILFNSSPHFLPLSHHRCLLRHPVGNPTLKMKLRSCLATGRRKFRGFPINGAIATTVALLTFWNFLRRIPPVSLSYLPPQHHPFHPVRRSADPPFLSFLLHFLEAQPCPPHLTFRPPPLRNVLNRAFSQINVLVLMPVFRRCSQNGC